MKVGSLLKRKGTEYHAIGPDQSITEAVQRMMERRIGSLLVLENEKLVSIITERDVMAAVDRYDGRINELKVRDMMASQLITCSTRDNVDEIMELMFNNPLNRRIRHLPVVDDGELRGVISISDVVAAMLTETRLENQLLKNYVRNWPEEP